MVSEPRRKLRKLGGNMFCKHGLKVAQRGLAYGLPPQEKGSVAAGFLVSR